jgi:hypothetical protein
MGTPSKLPRRQLPILVLVVLAVAVAAGCGSSKKSSTTTTTTTTAATTTAAAATTTTSSSGSGLAGIATAGNCRDIAGLEASLAAAITGTGTTDVQKTSALLKQFADHTPSDIRPDFEIVAAAYAKVADALKGVNFKAGQTPSASEIAKLEKLGTQINSAKLQQAATHITTWAQNNCHS